MMKAAKELMEKEGYDVVLGILAITHKRRLQEKRCAIMTLHCRMQALHTACFGSEDTRKWMMADERGINYGSGNSMIRSLKKEWENIYPGTEIFNVIGGDTAIKYSWTAFTPTVIINRRPHTKRVQELVIKMRSTETNLDKTQDPISNLYVVDELPGPMPAPHCLDQL